TYLKNIDCLATFIMVICEKLMEGHLGIRSCKGGEPSDASDGA
ncbi:MAG: hypothetical protein K0Q59_6037, partial [Paenibacillus sp.]|nr:hypothetical protein [Paenibacillus sp.]